MWNIQYCFSLSGDLFFMVQGHAALKLFINLSIFILFLENQQYQITTRKPFAFVGCPKSSAHGAKECWIKWWTFNFAPDPHSSWVNVDTLSSVEKHRKGKWINFPAPLDGSSFVSDNLFQNIQPWKLNSSF